MKVPFGGLILVIFLCSEMTSGQDIGGMVEMASQVVSYVFGVIQGCAQENNVGLMKLATSYAFSRSGGDRNSKCALGCIMENFFLISGDTVNTALLDGVIDTIPIEALKTPVNELVKMCGKKGNGPDKCENANAFVMCLRQNALTVAAKSFMG